MGDRPSNTDLSGACTKVPAPLATAQQVPVLDWQDTGGLKLSPTVLTESFEERRCRDLDAETAAREATQEEEEEEEDHGRKLSTTAVADAERYKERHQSDQGDGSLARDGASSEIPKAGVAAIEKTQVLELALRAEYDNAPSLDQRVEIVKRYTQMFEGQGILDNTALDEIVAHLVEACEYQLMSDFESCALHNVERKIEIFEWYRVLFQDLSLLDLSVPENAVLEALETDLRSEYEKSSSLDQGVEVINIYKQILQRLGILDNPVLDEIVEDLILICVDTLELPDAEAEEETLEDKSATFAGIRKRFEALNASRNAVLMEHEASLRKACEDQLKTDHGACSWDDVDRKRCVINRYRGIFQVLGMPENPVLKEHTDLVKTSYEWRFLMEYAMRGDLQKKYGIINKYRDVFQDMGIPENKVVNEEVERLRKSHEKQLMTDLAPCRDLQSKKGMIDKYRDIFQDMGIPENEVVSEQMELVRKACEDQLKSEYADCWCSDLERRKAVVAKHRKLFQALDIPENAVLKLHMELLTTAYEMRFKYECARCLDSDLARKRDIIVEYRDFCKDMDIPEMAVLQEYVESVKTACQEALQRECSADQEVAQKRIAVAHHRKVLDALRVPDTAVLKAYEDLAEAYDKVSKENKDLAAEGTAASEKFSEDRRSLVFSKDFWYGEWTKANRQNEEQDQLVQELSAKVERLKAKVERLSQRSPGYRVAPDPDDVFCCACECYMSEDNFSRNQLSRNARGERCRCRTCVECQNY